ncbi:MAG: hypothetical protein AAEJ57_03420, partial [Opitutales bacterium]
LDQATAGRDQAAKEKADRETARNQRAKQLADAESAHKSNKGQGDLWTKRASFRSNQVSLLRETHRKAKESHDSVPEDAIFKEAVAKQQEALVAMEKALEQALGKTAAHLAKADEFAKLATAHVATLAAATEALKAAEAILAQRERTRVEIESVIQAAQAEQVAKLAAHNAANALLGQRAKEQSGASEAEKGPSEMLRQAEVSLANARYSVAKWKAEQINVDRHLELGKLYESEDELKVLDEVADQAKAVHDQALATLESARKAFAEVPAKIKAGKEALSKRQASMSSENQNLENAKQVASEKQGFLGQVEKIASATKTKANGDAKNAELSAATAKLQESLELLKKDLANAQAGVASQLDKLEASQSAVQQAQAKLEQAKLLIETAPKVVHEKQTVTSDTQAKMTEANQKRYTFKTKVDAQRSKTEEILKKYLEALPK